MCAFVRVCVCARALYMCVCVCARAHVLRATMSRIASKGASNWVCLRRHKTRPHGREREWGGGRGREREGGRGREGRKREREGGGERERDGGNQAEADREKGRERGGRETEGGRDSQAGRQAGYLSSGICWASNTLGYIRSGSAQTIVRTDTLR